jgi:hypothetical protein
MTAQYPQSYPALPERVGPEILRRLNVVELMILCERFGARSIAARMGVDLASAIEQAANRGRST